MNGIIARETKENFLKNISANPKAIIHICILAGPFPWVYISIYAIIYKNTNPTYNPI